jgi:hypothetical protein
MVSDDNRHRGPDDGRPDALLDDIRSTRAEMDDTLDEIGRQLQPSHLADEAWRWTRDQLPEPKEAADYARRASRDIVGSIRRHPIPAALVGVGLVWLLSEEATGESVGVGDVAGAAGSAGAAAMSGARRAGSAAARGARSAGQAAGDRLSDTAQDAARSISTRDPRHAASERLDRAARSASTRARHAADATADAYRGNPLAFGLLAMAGGLIAGLAAPNTRAERRAFGERASELRSDALRSGERLAGRAMHAAADKLGDAADRGLNKAESTLDDASERFDSGSPADEALKHEASASAQTG